MARKKKQYYRLGADSWSKADEPHGKNNVADDSKVKEVKKLSLLMCAE